MEMKLQEKKDLLSGEDVLAQYIFTARGEGVKLSFRIEGAQDIVGKWAESLDISKVGDSIEVDMRKGAQTKL